MNPRSLALGLIMVVGAASGIQAQASAYVPLDDIAYTYLDALMARGYFRELSALERPYTERAIVVAIDSARASGPSSRASSYLDALYGSIQKYSSRPGNTDTTVAQSFRARFTTEGYVTAQTAGRRELMLPLGKGDVRPGSAIRMVMSGGPVVAAIRALIDTRLNADPEFPGLKDRRLAGRTEEGYASAQWKYGQLSFGRVGRNWGPSPMPGLMLGNYAYSYDHLYGQIGNDKVHFSTVVARLDDVVPAVGPTIERYFSIHRLTANMGNFEIAANESYVYAGAGRGLEFSLANPFNIYALSWRDENQEGNLGLGGEIAWRSRRFGTFAAQAFVDDYQIDRTCDPACKQPSSYALTFTAEGLPLRGEQRAFASYTRVANLTYNNKNPSEHYEIFGIGLGRGFSDYDEIRAGVDLAIHPRTPLRVYLAHRRQGEGSYNLPFPDPAAYGATPAIFSGVVTGVTRIAASGASRWRILEMQGDVGINHTTSDLHLAGNTTTRFEGRVKVAVVPRWSVNF
ncbi:MAG TPA: hypothetical protein VM166_15610 [Gemmatimonadaceae bacterium]|nr:hypothetical protein [Gemmatimonadaceae bacterium]